MCSPARGTGHGVRSRWVRTLYLVPCTLLLAAAASGAGCTQAVNAVAGVFGPGGVGETIDAHVVYRLRPDCPVLVARTTENGYTVLAPLRFLEGPTARDAAEFVGTEIEETGLFEGPVRTGEVVFRYVPPVASETWDAPEADVVAEVEAVRLSLPEAHAHVVGRCGPPPTPPADVPRTPARQ
jgi:hypothetical protein